MTLDERGLGRVQNCRRHVVIAAIFAFAAALLVIAPREPGGTTLHNVAEFGGFMAIIGAIMARLWCTLYIGNRKSAQLVTDGPYSLCRNPLYAASILGAVGVGLQTGMYTFGLIGCVLCWAIFAVVVRREEAFLEGRFGERYRLYCARTPRFLPRPNLWRETGPTHEFTSASLWRTLRDSSLFLLALPLTEVIEELHETGNLPAILSLY
jgi:protein-S-isoprenylcysteine O-methyltransferase Ste14